MRRISITSSRNRKQITIFTIPLWSTKTLSSIENSAGLQAMYWQKYETTLLSNILVTQHSKILCLRYQFSEHKIVEQYLNTTLWSCNLQLKLSDLQRDRTYQLSDWEGGGWRSTPCIFSTPFFPSLFFGNATRKPFGYSFPDLLVQKSRTNASPC